MLISNTSTENNHIEEANVLVVGAGGIGCELLKCLIMSGFKRISIVDMDTIEKSNLNRQFLFNTDSIGKYKSEMAIKSIQASRNDSSLKLKAYVGNIKDKVLFNESFFKDFDIILNALDNLDARYYINLICMRNNKPLVNSGSEGYLGSIGCHLRGLTPCYNCLNKVRQKSIPICSIRLHPEKIEHCVAWAKALFERVFGSFNNQSSTQTLDIIDKENLGTEDILHTLQMLFNDDIVELEHKHKFPIDIVTLYNKKSLKDESKKVYINFNQSVINADLSHHSIQFLICVLYQSYSQLLNLKPLAFDKENDTIINFIFSSSNLRAENFHIRQESRFKIKEIAGNIIPAISSTNSIVASIQVMECIKIINKQIDHCKNVGITSKRKIVSSTSIKEVINPDCFSCSEDAIKRFTAKSIDISIDLTITTLDMFIKQYCKVIDNSNEVRNATIEVNGQIIYETGDNLDDDEIEDNRLLRDKVLSSFKFYEDYQKTNKDIVMLVLNSESNEVIAKYLINHINTTDDNKVGKEEMYLLGKKRKVSID